MSVLLFLASAATAATWTVHPDGAGDFTDIPSAIAAAHAGDRVEVAAGSWDGPIDFAGKELVLIGVEGPARTRLSGGGAEAVLTFAHGETAGTRVEGFTLRDADRAIRVIDGSPTLANLVVSGFGEPTASGGAVWIGGGAPLFDGVRFANNIGTLGGAVHVSGGTPRFVACTFEGNGEPAYREVMSWGGAIYATHTDIELQDNLFLANLAQYGAHVALRSGGTLSSTGDRFHEGISSYGGVLLYHSTGATLREALFESNAAYYSGGAVYVFETDHLSVQGSIFTDNSTYSSGGGGGIHANTPGQLQVHDTAFLHNFSSYASGAAIWVTDAEGMELIDSELVGQASWGGGGAVYATLMRGPLQVRGTTFADNIGAHGGGGALHIDHSIAEVHLSEVVFSGNATGTHGGALHADDAELFLEDVVLTHNFAGLGGGALRVDSTRSTQPALRLHRLQAAHNHAEGDGGAVSVVGLAEAELVDLSLAHNLAEGAGGGLHVDELGQLTATRLRVEDNHAQYGGGLYIAHVGASSHEDGPAVQVKSAVLQQNRARSGGGLCLIASERAAVHHATIVGNEATEAGAGLCAHGGELELWSSVLAWNTGAAALDVLGADTRLSSSHNLWFGNSLDVQGADLSPTTELLASPHFANSTLDTDFPDPWTLGAHSPLRDAGASAERDPDGSPADIGAMGGPDTWQEDADGDGIGAWQDCDDHDRSVHPGQAEVWYDGIDTDCDGLSDFDADGDGVEQDDDCDDSDAARAADCTEAAPAEAPPEATPPTSQPSAGCSTSGSPPGSTGGLLGLVLLAGLFRPRGLKEARTLLLLAPGLLLGCADRSEPRSTPASTPPSTADEPTGPAEGSATLAPSTNPTASASLVSTARVFAPAPLEEVEEAVSEALAMAMDTDPTLAFPAIEHALAHGDEACPVYNTPYREAYGYDYWTGPCTTRSGHTHDGLIYGVGNQHYDSVYYDMNRYGWWMADYALQTADGQQVEVTGYLYTFDGVHHTGEREVYVEATDFGMSWKGGPWADSWLGEQRHLDYIASVRALPEGDVFAYLDGSVTTGSGRVSAVVFEEVFLHTEGYGSECAEEPSGRISIHLDDRRWYAVQFDGGAYPGASVFPPDCDGCGEVWSGDQHLGTICPDLSPLRDWEGRPWD